MSPVHKVDGGYQYGSKGKVYKISEWGKGGAEKKAHIQAYAIEKSQERAGKTPEKMAEGGEIKTPEELPISCAWCKKKIKKGGKWIEGTHPEGTKNLSHGICDDCREEVEKEIGLSKGGEVYTPKDAEKLKKIMRDFDMEQDFLEKSRPGSKHPKLGDNPPQEHITPLKAAKGAEFEVPWEWETGVEGEGGLKRWWPNKQLMEHSHWEKGRRHGESKSWHPNGRLRSHFFFEHGWPEGEIKEWDEEGNRDPERIRFEEGLQEDAPFPELPGYVYHRGMHYPDEGFSEQKPLQKESTAESLDRNKRDKVVEKLNKGGINPQSLFPETSHEGGEYVVPKIRFPKKSELKSAIKDEKEGIKDYKKMANESSEKEDKKDFKKIASDEKEHLEKIKEKKDESTNK